MKREYAALTGRQLTGSHNYLLLGKEIAKVHDHFNITENLVATTTNNGSNFVKAFSVFGPCDDDNEEATTNIDLFDALDVGLINEPDLPPHHRCAAHTLNLVATTDSECAKLDTTYKKIGRSTFAKCQALWNKYGRTTSASEIVAKEAGLLQLVCPCAMRWNSVFDAVTCLNRVCCEKGNSALSNICHGLDVPRECHELELLESYEHIMKPLAQALDILQGDKNTLFGFLVPTLERLK